MKVDLAALKSIFAFAEASVSAEFGGQRTLMMKASATMAVTAAG